MDCKEIRTEAEVSGSRGYLLAKRLQDILLSGLALVALSPLLLLIAVPVLLLRRREPRHTMWR